MTKPKLLFFTGAGISAESGLQTFRDAKDGLWNNYKIEEVCTPKHGKKILVWYWNSTIKEESNV